jgi:hypothetical protein
MSRARVFQILALLCVLMPAATATAQQTGAVIGKVTDTSGAVLPGVTVEASSNVLPTPRVTTTGNNGEYRMPALPPGTYALKFELSGMQTVSRQALVQLGQDTVADATLGVGMLEEAVTVTAATTLVERDSATIKSGVSSQQISSLPVGQEYRDLIKLIPGVMYTQEGTRGPSAGGSGQDNVYQFDGANVTLPLFGTLASEPASHDIAQVTTIKGGARAIDFDRSGGFTIDSASKSGTNRFNGELSYEYQGANMISELVTQSRSRYEQDRQWLTVNGGGPLLRERLFFYGSYYRPENSRDNRANDYGPLPSYERTRNEGFGKVTFTPTHSILSNVSYRDSHRRDRSDLFGQSSAATTGTGDEAWQRITSADGSWVINSRSHATVKFTRFELETLGQPDNVANVTPTDAIGTRLDVSALDRMGLLTVPSPVADQTAYNSFIQPFIDRYGFVSSTTGQLTGGGLVGFGSQFNDQDFFRDNIQFAYNVNLGGRLSHDLHAGFQWYRDVEDLRRYSNGWGEISIPGGRLAAPAGTTQPAYFTATYQQQTSGAVSPIKSEYQSKSFEINDTIRMNDWTFNVGVLASNDTLYGQGLREDSSKPLTGFVASRGTRYKMYDIPFGDMIQPRLAATWAYNGGDTVYASFARYNPAASSLPRAASWDRNLIGLLIDAHFDQNGTLFAAIPRNSSAGKLFQDDLTPRTINEFLVGTAKAFTPSWSGRLYARTRRGSHFWEDTQNNARTTLSPPQGIPRQLYIEDLTARLAEIGTGGTNSAYVIAELDGAYTRYYEATVESEWRTQKGHFVRGSYTLSRYYGNMDQDNSSTANDDNIFIGSSNIADGAGRQLWDSKEGTLRGDRPHMFKAYGYYLLPWHSTVGVFAVAQSGQPWEGWSVEPYRALTTSTSVTNRYAERAGIRRSPAHYQMDLKYIQNIRLSQLGDRTNIQLLFDVYNVFNKQTGYNYQPNMNISSFNTPRNYYDPRRLHVTVRLQF